jgi:hypothetical protein
MHEQLAPALVADRLRDAEQQRRGPTPTTTPADGTLPPSYPCWPTLARSGVAAAQPRPRHALRHQPHQPKDRIHHTDRTDTRIAWITRTLTRETWT